MIRRIPGVSTEDAQRGLKLLEACSTREDLERALEEEPVLSDPDFHVAFREQTATVSDEGTRSFLKALQDDLFLLLHLRIQDRVAKEEAARPRSADALRDGGPSPAEGLVPFFLLAVHRTVGSRVPIAADAPLRPAVDATELAAQLEQMSGGVVSLPPYEPVAGIRWSLLVVGCPGCAERRIVLHAYYVDLRVADVQRAWTPRSEEEARCPSCGCLVCSPLFIWVQEESGPTDVLNAASTVVRVGPSCFLQRLPHGPRRDPRSDRVFEMRFCRMLDEIGCRAAEAEEVCAHVTNLVTTYGDQEVTERIEAMQPDAPIPFFSMEAFVSDVAQKMRTGYFPLSHVEAELREPRVRLDPAWPLVLHRETFAPEPHHRLAHALVAEELGRRRGVPPLDLAVFARQTSHAYLLLEEPALAEMALVRAEDAHAEAPAGPDRDGLQAMLMDTRAVLSVKLGDYAAAVAIHTSLIGALAEPTTLPERVMQLQWRATLAKNLFRAHRPAEAIRAFEDTIPGLEAVWEETRSDPDAAITGLSRNAQHSLSGALANCGKLLAEMADFVELLGITAVLSQTGSTTTGMPEDALRAVYERDELLRVRSHFDAPKAKPFFDALGALSDYMTKQGIEVGDQNPLILRSMARRMLERAISLAEEVGGWTFAARQMQSLASLLEEEGDERAAEEVMRRALAYGERVDDHATLIQANTFFADRLGKRGDGAGALPFVKTAAREAVRQLVGFGRHDRGRAEVHALGWVALNCARFGASPLEAIVVAESVKAIPLTISLGRRIPRTDTGSMVRDPRYAQWCDATGLDVDDAAKFLERIQRLGRTVYIGFLRGSDRIWTYAVWGDRSVVQWSRLRPSDEELLMATPDVCLREDTLRRWAEILLSPLEAPLSTLRPDDRLVISVDEAVSHVPFAALPWGDRRLCEHANLCHVQGGGLFSVCAAREANFGSALCVGNPSRADKRALPAAEAEAEAVAASFRSKRLRATVLTRDHATIRAVMEEARAADVLHFACHAAAPPGAPPGALPALLLAPEVDAGDTGALSDERIVAELVLRPGCLVNLSACESAAHADGSGPNVQGLVPAFLVCGAASVLASLWRIRDNDARIFSEELYANLLAGAEPAVALARTQRAFLCGEFGEERRASERWASYVIYGVR
jgi:hypothetical protein